MLLFEPHELPADGTVTLQDDRARHLLAVLRVSAGQRLVAGVVDGDIGSAEVLAVDGTSVHLRVDCRSPAPVADDVLLLAVPRPKVLLRILELGAALGCGRIVLFRSWRVDKSHLDSNAFDPAVQRRHLCRGLEQAQRTRLPRVQFFPLFRPFVEDTLPTLPLPAHRLCAHPDAPVRTADLALGHGAPFALAIGPEGGFLPYEVDQLAARGFLAARLSPHPLRTEAAVASLFAQLDLLRSRR